MSVTRHTRYSALEINDVHVSDAAGGSLKMGTSAAPITSAVAGMKFISKYTEHTLAAGTSYGEYIRHYVSGAGASANALRAYLTVSDVAAATAVGAHLSVSFGTLGSITGLGVAARATLHVPAAMTNGTYAPLMAEIWADAATSDLAGATDKAFVRIVLGGDATGAALIEDTINLIHVTGGSNASGNMVGAQGDEPTWASHTFLVRCKINGATLYIPMISL
jgi:hypothetical protein